MEHIKTMDEVKKRFGKTLMQHVEKLAGDALPSLAFPVDVDTLACFVLLTEREAQLKGNESMQRFTANELLLEISDLGVPTNGNPDAIIRRMEKGGYVSVQEDGFLLSKTPLVELCRILDEIFPKMPGLNLVAYLVQTMEEVLSGRKGLDEAHLQLDQALEMHGVPLSGNQNIHDAKEGAPSSSRVSASRQKGEGEEKGKKAPGKGNRKAMLKLLQAAARVEAQKKTVSSSKLIRAARTVPSDRNEKGMENPDESPGKKSLDEELPIHVRVEKTGDPEALDTRSEEPGEIEESSVDTNLPAHSHAYPPVDQLSEKPNHALDAVPESSENDPGMAGPEIKASEESETGQSSKTEGKEEENHDQESSGSDDGLIRDRTLNDREQESDPDDKEIEDRIAAFEEDLAMTCPLCGKGKITEQETAKGKRFYECSRDGCYFVSWGKPYYLGCPKCQNNFLIEAVDAAGKIFLKCPRATCNYTQSLPGEDGDFEEIEKKVKKANKGKSAPGSKKKVVRRRLVRRKK